MKINSVITGLFRYSPIQIARLLSIHFSSQQPILIGGCGRSGTSMLLAILDSHSRIIGIDQETDVFKTKKSYKEKLSIIYSYLLKKGIKKGVKTWCEKTPMNIVFTEQILKDFNDKVKIIHIVRDGRDVITSYHPSRKGEYYVSPERWIHDVSCGLAFEAHPQVYLIKYEDIISDFEQTVSKLLGFIGLEYEEGLKKFDTNTSIKKHGAWEHGVMPLHNNSLKKWQKPEFEHRIKHFHSYPKANELMEYLDYEVS